MKPISVQHFLNSEDPLSNEAFEFLLDYKEEDYLIDYKVDFDFHQEKEWLEITKDIIAFSNTYGGYLIFGVRDGTFDIVGLDEDVTKLLTDTDTVLQKINRYVDPPISLLRSKKYIRDKKQTVGILIPIASGITHVVSKDGSFKYPSGKEKVVLHKGTIYVRRSAGNQLVSSRDIDDIVNRRLDQFKESLLDKITRVVEAPVESSVVILSQDTDIEGDQRFIIDNEPGAISVKGMSFSTPPETPEQEIASWAALFSKYKTTIPPNEVLWGWYKIRHSINISERYRMSVAEFCALSDVPPFFWLQGCSAHFLKEMINDAIANKTSYLQNGPILNVSAFLGKRFYDSISKKLASKGRFPVSGPRSQFPTTSIELMRKSNKYSEEKLRSALENELTEIADKLQNRKNNKVENYQKLLWQANNIDCYLYAQDDKYR